MSSKGDPKVVVVNGAAGAGKDTFVRACMSILPASAEISTVTMVKQAAALLGWDGKKTDSARRFLSDIKDAWTRYCDGSFNHVRREIYMQHENGIQYFFIHCREPEEISKFAGYYNGWCHTVLIRRPGTEIPDNHADQRVDMYPYDHRIENTGTIGDLQRAAFMFCFNQFI